MSKKPDKPKKAKTGGRKAGTPNKLTADVRAALSLVIQGNTTKFARMMNKIKDPKQYCDVFLKAAEFNIPKLAKVEQTVRHAVTPEQMSDAELQALAGDTAPDVAGRVDRESPRSRPH